MRIGIGYDAHKLVEGRKLIIGGVEIPYQKGLLGHSDADVLVHAIMDAILGALAAGSIGDFFPDSDDKYKNISSLLLLAQIGEFLKKEGYKIVNIDTVIVAQEPKMAKHILNMRNNIAQVLNIKKELVGIKATTTEGLGFEGKKEGIAAQAVALLDKV
jgi:2-C-methyl-D-erythritol 2,4-cyclodiphosphate synthase